MGATGNTQASGSNTDWQAGLLNVGTILAQGYADKLGNRYTQPRQPALATNLPPTGGYTPSIIALPAQTASAVPAPSSSVGINPSYLLIGAGLVVLLIVLKNP